MNANLLEENWSDLDLHELRLLLRERIGGLGQTDQRRAPNKLFIPSAGDSCRLELTFGDHKVTEVRAGPAFDKEEWQQIADEIENSILAGPTEVGRDCSFSSFRVDGSWRGEHSGVQILPPPCDAPRAPVEVAEHPFILEFPITVATLWPITNHRRMLQHRRLTLVLNVLLHASINIQPRRSDHFWAALPSEPRKWYQIWRKRKVDREIKWAQQFYFAKFGEAVIGELSPPSTQQLEQLEPDEYYESIGHDGKGLRIPCDLDESILLYMRLSPIHQAKFDRAAFWIDQYQRLWNSSVSGSFAALVSAIEALTNRGNVHRFDCPKCGKPTQHEVPGSTQRFRDFLDTYAPGSALAKRRNEMYGLRSGILHGSKLMELDQDLSFGWDPPWWNERELHSELSGVTRTAVRNWLKNPE